MDFRHVCACPRDGREDDPRATKMTRSDHLTPPRTRFAPSPRRLSSTSAAPAPRSSIFSTPVATAAPSSCASRTPIASAQTDASIAAILESLTWLEIAWDEGPFFQSQRTAVYVAEAERLLREGRAYPCYCTAGELEAKRAAALAAGQEARLRRHVSRSHARARRLGAAATPYAFVGRRTARPSSTTS